MKAMMEYTQTASALAREAGCLPDTVRNYAKAGWLDYVTASNGIRLFRGGQALRVREILAERMARRGRAPSAAA